MKKQTVLVLIVAMMLSFTGCGKQEKLIELTDEQRAEIVHFSAHIISEFNRGQPEGYRPLNAEQIDRIKNPKKAETSVQPGEQQSQSEAGGDNSSTGGQEKTVESSTLTELVGTNGIEAVSKGYKVQRDYVQDNVFAMNAEEGKVYVVLKIRLTNTTSQKVMVDILGKNPSISLQINDAESTTKAMMTLLPNDFRTFQQKIRGGKSVDTVLIFEVDKSVADSIDKVSLVTKDGATSKMILIN
ncbi:hypothetical protein SAMN02910358_00576 [Lachnospiraceae bacterium XBB1006]|nr:hypothetical protein SAMN02910358_00576 [Lachnospiraceae bacterium XBB1006]